MSLRSFVSLPRGFARAPRTLVTLLIAGMLAGCGSSSGGDGASGEPPPLPALPDGFHIGYAEARLDLPIGVSLGGYGARYDALLGTIQGLGATPPRAPDARPSPFTVLFEPSIGVHTWPMVRAVALTRVADSLEERLVIAEVDSIFTTTSLRDAVLEAIAERTGFDLSQELHITCSHTHQGGAGFYNNVFGAVAVDAFSPEIFARYVESLVGVVISALEARAPGRIGAIFFEDFDPDDAIYKDRRAENNAGDLVTNADPSRADPRSGELLPDGLPDGPMKDRRLAVFRLEAADGTPLAAIVHFPIHGTALSPTNLFISTDAPGLIQDKAQERIGVPVMHFQGASGDIQPELDLVPTNLTPVPGLSIQFQMMERVADRAAAVIGDLFDAIEITGEPDRLRSATVTYRQDRQLVGYDEALPPYDQFDAPNGALFCALLSDAFFFLPIEPPANLGSPFQCLSRPVSLNLDFLSDAVAGLIFPLLTDEFGISSHTEDLLDDLVIGINPIGGPFEKPGDLFYSRVSFFQIDGIPVASIADPTRAGRRTLSFFGVPGEATTPWAFETRRKMALRVPSLAFEDLFVVGYTNDYQSYLVNKEDWLFGGSRELGTAAWGPLWGEFVRERVLDLVSVVAQDLPVPEGPEIPVQDPVPSLPVRPTVSPSTGFVLGPADTDRFGMVSIAFLGGDPIVDVPHVLVEVEDASGNFVPVRFPGGRVLDEGAYRTMLVYEYDETSSTDPHLWSFHWPITEDDPTGRFRIRVQGFNYDETAPTGNPARYRGAAYEFVSSPFLVRPTRAIAVEDLTLGSNVLGVELRYPTVPDSPDPNVADAFRDMPVQPRGATYEIRVLDADSVVLEGTGELGGAGRGRLPDTLPAGRYDVEISVEDAYGNTGSARFLDVAVSG